MKRLIDDNGTFEIKVPITWKYSVENGKIHTFQDYVGVTGDTLQLSINTLDTDQKKNNFITRTKYLPVTKIGDHEYFTYPNIADKESTTKTWTRLCLNKVILFSLTYVNTKSDGVDAGLIEKKVEATHSIIEQFKLIPKEQSLTTINSYRLEMFLQGMAATEVLLSKAITNRSFIEAICMIATQIDALLRIGIILKNQLTNQNKEIQLKWIYQGLLDKKINEKHIYTKARKIEVIDESKYHLLCRLYEYRNRVIHRFIISEITLVEIEKIAFQYYKMKEEIFEIVNELELQQINTGIGMTITKENTFTTKDLLNTINGKFGKPLYSNEIPS